MQTEPTMLVVEDDEGHLYLLTQQLKRIGITWPMRRFSDGQQAVDFFAREFAQIPTSPMVLLLDLRLPKVDGTAILARIRSSQSLALQQLPTIIITSSCNPDDRNECERLGCNAYLTKPFSLGELRSAIQQALPGNIFGIPV